MQIGPDGFFHLTYCTKIHPTQGWEELFASVSRCVPALKARLAPDSPFGLGLRLTDAESREMLNGDNFARFQDFLSREGVYVFTLNGFPYGPFRGPSVKARVFAPDWREAARVTYTGRLTGILARLLPPGLTGSISTLPLSYKPWIAQGDTRAMLQISGNLARLVRLLMQMRERYDRVIHLDLEPEADGLLENTTEVVDFFHKWLLPHGAPLLAGWAGISRAQAETEIMAHIQICLDTCHMAVAYEEPATVADRLAANGLSVGKVQVTSGLKFLIPETSKARLTLRRRLESLARSPYLHQVRAQRADGSFHQYHDLPEALARLDTAANQQWRLHFHMPLYAQGYEGLEATQAETRRLLLLLKERRFCPPLELETYTWEVVPPAMQDDILDCLEREYRWTLDILGPGA